MQHLSMRRSALLTLGVAAALALGSCSGGPAGDSGDAGGGGADLEPLKVSLITHAAPGDTFWDIVRKGAETAADTQNIDLLYSSDPDGARQAQLVDQAKDLDVDGIVVTLAKPEAMAQAVESALAAGIPVYSINAGEDSYEAMGVLAHFGQNEEIAGEAAGGKLNELGAKRIICVIQEQGHVGLESRCEGVKTTFDGEYEVLYVQGTDMANVSSTITSKLQTNTDIDYVLTLGAPFAMTALDAVTGAGSDAKVATFDMNSDVIKKVEDGSIEFVIDQQPYLQGYAAVMSVRLYVDNGNVLGGGKAVLTGPQIIDQALAGAVAKFAANGTR